MIAIFDLFDRAVAAVLYYSILTLGAPLLVPVIAVAVVARRREDRASRRTRAPQPAPRAA